MYINVLTRSIPAEILADAFLNNIAYSKKVWTMTQCQINLNFTSKGCLVS